MSKTLQLCTSLFIRLCVWAIVVGVCRAWNESGDSRFSLFIQVIESVASFIAIAVAIKLAILEVRLIDEES